MNALNAMTLLAQGYLEMGRNFRSGGGGFSFTKLIILFAIMGGVGAIAWGLAAFYRMSSSTEACNHPGKLFRELCDAHGLNWTSRRLVKQVVDRHNLQQPALVFLDQTYWEPFGDKEFMVKLRDRLFSSEPQED